MESQQQPSRYAGESTTARTYSDRLNHEIQHLKRMLARPTTPAAYANHTPRGTPYKRQVNVTRPHAFVARATTPRPPSSATTSRRAPSDHQADVYNGVVSTEGNKGNETDRPARTYSRHETSQNTAAGRPSNTVSQRTEGVAGRRDTRRPLIAKRTDMNTAVETATEKEAPISVPTSQMSARDRALEMKMREDDARRRTVQEVATSREISQSTSSRASTGTTASVRPSRPMPTEQYTLGKVIGQGAFGKVKLAVHNLTGQHVAVKTYEKYRMVDADHKKRVQREISILKKMDHTNIIRLYEVVETPKRMYLVMEYAGGGDLCSYVRNKKRLNEVEAAHIFSQVMDGIVYCHGMHVIHRDIKLDNILFDETGKIKVVDFGLSVWVQTMDTKLRLQCGSPSYTAPEIISKKPYVGPPVDVWSLGVLLYALLCGHFPFQGNTRNELFRRVVRGEFRIPDYVSPGARDLIRKMLVTDPAKRYSLPDTMNHSWLAKMKSLPSPQPTLSFSSSTSSYAIDSYDREHPDEEVIQELVDTGMDRKDLVSVSRLLSTFWISF